MKKKYTFVFVQSPKISRIHFLCLVLSTVNGINNGYLAKLINRSNCLQINQVSTLLKVIARSLGNNSIIQNSMLHLELEIQIRQGWQFLCYCRNAIEKIIVHLHLPFFPNVLHVYSN